MKDRPTAASVTALPTPPSSTTTPVMSPADFAAHLAASHLSPRGVAYLARCEKALRKAVAA